jgi:hypothetical protein
VLVRAYQETREKRHLEASRKAFDTFLQDVKDGGVTYSDGNGYVWFEETIVDPPTHILNGFIWAAWGVYDYFLQSGYREAERLLNGAVKTIRDNLALFDAGFWSLYEQSGTRMKMLASPFYHSLHIIQLRVMHKLTGDPVFTKFAEKWDGYRRNPIKRYFALCYKVAFKLLYY